MPTFAASFSRLYFLIVVIVLYSCNSTQDKTVISALNEGLETSNEFINISNSEILNLLQEKTIEPISQERARIWYPNADKIRVLSDSVYNYLEALKKEKNYTS